MTGSQTGRKTDVAVRQVEALRQVDRLVWAVRQVEAVGQVDRLVWAVRQADS